jgi:hypothetical protein
MKKVSCGGKGAPFEFERQASTQRPSFTFLAFELELELNTNPRDTKAIALDRSRCTRGAQKVSPVRVRVRGEIKVEKLGGIKLSPPLLPVVSFNCIAGVHRGSIIKFICLAKSIKKPFLCGDFIYFFWRKEII